jgi:hypothetical protein
VKAAAEIFPDERVGDCFNSQVAASQATSGDCGITVQRLATGRYSVNFGFEATNRFVSVTPETDGSFSSVHATVNNPLVVYTYNVFRGAEGDPFYIIVF